MSLGTLAEALAARGVRLDSRHIEDTEAGSAPDASATWERRRASAAARMAARHCLCELGGPVDASLLRAARGFPVWPQGFLGSLAHDETLAVAVAARSEDVKALGVDVEAVEALPDDVFGFALSPEEQELARTDPPLGKGIFAAKEAVYKAVNPYDGSAPEYEDIQIDLAEGLARLRDGRTLRLLWSRDGRWIVVALGR